MQKGIEEIIGRGTVAPALDFPQSPQTQQEDAEDKNKIEFEVIYIILMLAPSYSVVKWIAINRGDVGDQYW